jgi:flavorubredoxin
MEPDHSGCIEHLMHCYPDMHIVTSARAVQMLSQFFVDTDFSNRTITIKEGDTLSLGKHTLQFIMAPMVHWPEVFVSYEQSEKILFSADAFGKFGALSHEEEWACEARRYYFNICGKYGAQVQALLKKVSEVDVSQICPLHGPILQENVGYYMSLYDTWSSYKPEAEGVFIAYASIHGNTANAACAIADMFRAAGVKVSLADLSRDDMAEAIEDAFKYDRMIVAASSYDGDLFPPMYDFLHHLQLKNYQNRKVGIVENGSWAPSAGRVMRKMLEEMKGITITSPMVTLRSALKPSDMERVQTLVTEMSK